MNTREVVNIEQGLAAAGFAVTSGRWLDHYDRLYEQAKKDYLEKIYKMAGEHPEWVIGLMFDHPFFEPDTPEITEADVAESETDTAVFVITRNSGEGKDRVDREGDYRLTAGEEQAVRFLAAHYEKCIVLLNVGGVIDLSVLNGIQGVNALLLAGQLGNTGGCAVADVLAGEGIPSGKLTDTWAKKYSDYPSSAEFSQNNGNLDDEYYKDGIYVGYRYFDTFGVEPEYCFGYGLGYTTFVIRVNGVSAEHGKITVSAAVENTGKNMQGARLCRFMSRCRAESWRSRIRSWPALRKQDCCCRESGRQCGSYLTRRTWHPTTCGMRRGSWRRANILSVSAAARATRMSGRLSVWERQ